MPTQRRQRTIVAYATEDGRLDDVRSAAVDLARRGGDRLILYDVDAAGFFQKPLPTNWSGERSEGEFGDLLGPADLERAGRQRSPSRSSRRVIPVSTRGAGCRETSARATWLTTSGGWGRT